MSLGSAAARSIAVVALSALAVGAGALPALAEETTPVPSATTSTEAATPSVADTSTTAAPTEVATSSSPAATTAPAATTSAATVSTSAGDAVTPSAPTSTSGTITSPAPRPSITPAASTTTTGAATAGTTTPAPTAQHGGVYLFPRLEGFGLDRQAGETRTLVTAGRSTPLFAFVELPSPGTVTDVKASSTGRISTEEDCAHRPESTEGMSCTIDSRPVAAGATLVETLTVTGKLDGVPFTRTGSVTLVGVDVTVKVTVHGKDVTGMDVPVLLTTSTPVTVEISNRSGLDLRAADAADYFLGGCAPQSVPAHSTRSCTFGFDPDEYGVESLRKVGAWVGDTYVAHSSDPSAYAILYFPVTRLIGVDQIPADWYQQQPTTPRPQPGQGPARPHKPTAKPTTGAPQADSVPLAQTGVAVGGALLAALLLIGGGLFAVRAARR